MPEGRHAEVWGSVAAAYGRLYFTTEEGLYCLGRKGAPFKAGRAPVEPAEAPAPAPTAAAGAAPDRAGRGDRAAPDEPVAFEAWAFDDKGRFLRKETATWTLEGIAGEISADGRLTDPRPAATTAGKVKATAGRAVRHHAGRASSRPLPWSVRLRGGPGAAPLDRGRPALQGHRPRRRQAPAQAARRRAGLQRAAVFIGPPTPVAATPWRPTCCSRSQGRRAGRPRPDQPGLHAGPDGQEAGAAAADLGLRAREVGARPVPVPSPTSGTA